MATVSSLEVNLARRAAIGDIPKRTAAKYPNRVALVWQDKRITFQELNESCCRFANALLKSGIRKGDRDVQVSYEVVAYSREEADELMYYEDYHTNPIITVVDNDVMFVAEVISEEEDDE